MSKKYNHNGLPKKRVIVAAEQEMRKRVATAEKRGVRRGRGLGEMETMHHFDSLSLWKRLKLVFVKYGNV